MYTLLLWSILLFTSCSPQHSPQDVFGEVVRQDTLHRIGQMPDLPQPYRMKNWSKTATDYYTYVFDFDITGSFRPFIWMDHNRRNFDQETFGIYTAVGDVREGPDTHNGEAHEGLCVLGALYGGSLMGIDFTEYEGRDFVNMSRNYFNRDNGWNIVMNFTTPSAHIGGGYGNDWWYDVFNNMLFFAIGDQYPEEKGYEEIMRIVANQFYKADSILGDNYSYSCFDFKTMQGIVNQIPTQEDAAAGFSWILYAAYERFGDEKYLRASEHALEVLLSQKENRFYEVLMPFGAYVAARLNAEHGMDYDVEKILNWTFDGTATNRIGWGVMADRWGGYDVHGLAGSTVDRGGYAFLMNGFDLAWPLVPMVRYDPRYAVAIGKWMLNVANASRLFYSDQIPDSLQVLPGKQDITHHVIAYEGLIHESQDPQFKGRAPIAQGDGPLWAQGNPPESMFSLYGSGHVGIFGSIIDTTDVRGILRLDCLATDLFRTGDAFPTYLYYNPYGEAKQLSLNAEDHKDVYDVISKTLVTMNTNAQSMVTIQGKSAVLLVLIPAGTELVKRNGQLLANGVVVDYQVSPSNKRQ